MPASVFISHSHQDRALAQSLISFLVHSGIDLGDIRCTSYPPTGLAAGANIAQELRRDIEGCDCFIPLITANTRNSEFVLFEIGSAWGLEKKILPVVYSKTSRIKLPAVLSDRMYIDLTDLDGLVKLAKEVAHEIYVKTDQPPPDQVLAAARAFLSLRGTARSDKMKAGKRIRAKGRAPRRQR